MQSQWERGEKMPQPLLKLTFFISCGFLYHNVDKSSLEGLSSNPVNDQGKILNSVKRQATKII